MPGLGTLPGWWRAHNASMVAHRCLQASQCAGGPESTCLGNREGPLVGKREKSSHLPVCCAHVLGAVQCAMCIDGYEGSPNDSVCTK